MNTNIKFKLDHYVYRIEQDLEKLKEDIQKLYFAIKEVSEEKESAEKSADPNDDIPLKRGDTNE